MTIRSRGVWVAGLSAVLGGAVSAEAASITLESLGVYSTGQFDESAAEIPAYDPATQQLYVVNATRGVDVLSLSNPSLPSLLYSLNAPGTNSVAIVDGMVALAVQADNKTDNGRVAFFDTAGNALGSASAGALPDMLTFTPDRRYVITANEGEPNDDYDVDPVGSVTIVDTSDYSSRQAVFDAFNTPGALDSRVRVFGPGATPAQDLEPEYIAVSSDSQTAYVALQENNAIAVVDLASATVTDVLPLGFKDHSLPGNELDASNRDDAIRIESEPVFGMYQPDAISVVEKDGRTFIITANEGDSRDYDGFSEEARVEDLTLDPTAFPNAATLQLEENLGRLNVTTTLGDTDGDGDYDELYAYGGRSFSVFEVTENDGGRSLNLVFDSGDQLEQITASLLPDNFNSTNDENGSFDSRSDDKGPEPEGLTVGQVDGKTYLFVGLERVGGVMVYDITDPTSPAYVSYGNTRNFDVQDVLLEDGSYNLAVGDLGPEGLLFISAEDSPIGQPLLVVANEVSGTTRIFAVRSDGSGPSVVPTPSAAAAGLAMMAGLLQRRRRRNA